VKTGLFSFCKTSDQRKYKLKPAAIICFVVLADFLASRNFFIAENWIFALREIS